MDIQVSDAIAGGTALTVAGLVVWVRVLRDEVMRLRDRLHEHSAWHIEHARNGNGGYIGSPEHMLKEAGKKGRSPEFTG